MFYSIRHIETITKDEKRDMKNDFQEKKKIP